ncbi:hypothetical protein BJ508DRAFT_379211 [Ascobolus immersus RN42]|uniref:F-box domain-containing protein n=1 Tax=Ascobolus immersus RN42 TaxID=1160509 RepID=A0A3N4HUD5_ASCIM|nr:hypothetical protein BJ508DRAFT_379211 [Ascobolus immersus RN42]
MAEHLPPNILARVLRCIDSSGSRGADRIEKYALLSRQWAQAVELWSGRFSSIVIRSDELNMFSTVYQATHRRQALSQITNKIVLPKYHYRRCVLFETRKEQRRNNEAVTEAIQSFFSLLATWESGDKGGGNSIDLSIIGFSPADFASRDEPFRMDFLGEHFMASCFHSWEKNELYPGWDIKERRWRHSYLKLSRDVWEGLPQLHRITALRSNPAKCENRNYPITQGRTFEGWTLAKLAAKLPNLRFIDWVIKDADLLYPKKRIQHREDFAAALMESLREFRDLTTFILDTSSILPQKDTFDPPGLHDDDVPEQLTEALQNIIRLPHLQVFKIDKYTVLSPYIFDAPVNIGTRDATARPFQNLKTVNLHLSTVTPSGTHYFDTSSPLPEDFEPPARYEFSEPENHYPALKGSIKRTLEEDDGSDLELVGQNSDGDYYQYPPRYTKRYKRDVDEALGRDGRFFHRDRVDTDGIRQILKGFIDLVASAPKVEHAMVTLGARRYRGRHSYARLAYGYFGLDEKVWRITKNRDMQGEVAVYRGLRETMELVDGGRRAIVYGPPELREIFPSLQESFPNETPQPPYHPPRGACYDGDYRIRNEQEQ